MSPHQFRSLPDDPQPSSSPYQEPYRWMVKPFLFMLLFAFIGVLFSECRSVWLGLPGDAESVLYERVINNPENTLGCAKPETRCRGITILKVYNIPFTEYETQRWCVVWGGNRWNPNTAKDEQFQQIAIISAPKRGDLRASSYNGRCDGD